MILLGQSFRDMENLVPKLNLPWDEPYPDHSTIHDAYQKIPAEYLDAMLARTAQLCIEESGWTKGTVAPDSTGARTDRYETVVRPNRKKKKFEKVRKRITLKLHVIAILDHLIILKARVTSSRAADCTVARGMLRRLMAMPGSVFNADRGFDAEYIFERVFQLLMLPNIKQRVMAKGPRGKGRKRLRYRSRAKKLFDKKAYRYRGLVEAVFGAEETDEHNDLFCRLRKKGNREIWGIIIAMGWTLKVLNRLRCMNSLGMEVKPIAL
jgi:hypothetical protein